MRAALILAVAAAVAHADCTNQKHSQCNGQNWSLDSCCVDESYGCVYFDEYYSECLPVQANATTIGPNGQCGGKDWTGLTTCLESWSCTVVNDDYSHCTPIFGGKGVEAGSLTSDNSSTANSTTRIRFLRGQDDDTVTTLPTTESPLPESPTTASVSTAPPTTATPTVSINDTARFIISLHATNVTEITSNTTATPEPTKETALIEQDVATTAAPTTAAPSTEIPANTTATPEPTKETGDGLEVTTEQPTVVATTQVPSGLTPSTSAPTTSLNDTARYIISLNAVNVTVEPNTESPANTTATPEPTKESGGNLEELATTATPTTMTPSTPVEAPIETPTNTTASPAKPVEGGTVTAANVADVVEAYGQCGGLNYDGPTICVDAFACQVANEYYSQCLPIPDLPGVATFGQCGGSNYDGPTECQWGSYCYAWSEWYSQCLPGKA